MWEILLNSVLSGWFKLLIVVLARKWVVLLTNCKWAVVNSTRTQKRLKLLIAGKWAVLLANCKWAVVNSIRIQKWAAHSYKSQMGYKFSTTHF